MEGVRWAFRCGSWVPTRSEWTLAARCVQLEEKERIGQFVFAKDAKSAMVGDLHRLDRKMTHRYRHTNVNRQEMKFVCLPGWTSADQKAGV